MKSIKLSALFAALGLAFTAVTSQANPYFNCNVQATIYEQAPSTTNGTKTVYNVNKIKITTKDILNLIAENYGHADGYYNGASLVEYDLEGSFYIYNGNPNKGGTEITSVDDYLLWDGYDMIFPENGFYNRANGSYNYGYHFVYGLHFTDYYYNNYGYNFKLTGAATSDWTYSNSTGFKGSSFSATGPIDGYIWGNYFSGAGTVNGTY